MQVLNLSNHQVLTPDLKIAASFMDQFFGLLRKTNLSGSMLFKTRFGIHTFFMKEAIDVIVLDRATSRHTSERSCNFSKTQNYRNFKVVKMKELKPNKLFFWNPKYFLVLELPKGTIKKTKKGDILSLRTE